MWRLQVYGFDGVNLDFEPRWKASPEDAAGLLNFVRPPVQVTPCSVASGWPAAPLQAQSTPRVTAG